MNWYTALGGSLLKSPHKIVGRLRVSATCSICFQNTVTDCMRNPFEMTARTVLTRYLFHQHVGLPQLDIRELRIGEYVDIGDAQQRTRYFVRWKAYTQVSNREA